MLIEVIKLKRKAAFKYLPELAPTTSGFKVADCPQYKLAFYRVLCFFIVIFFFFFNFEDLMVIGYCTIS